jgi:hypothetical protein
LASDLKGQTKCRCLRSIARKSLAFPLHDRIAERPEPRRICSGVAGKKPIFYQFITVMLGFDWMGAMWTKRVRKS